MLGLRCYLFAYDKHAKSPEPSVSDDICDIFRGKVILSDLIFCSLSALLTPVIARRQRISRDYISCDRSVQAFSPQIAIGNIRGPYNLAFSLVEMLLLETMPFPSLLKNADAKAMPPMRRLTSLPLPLHSPSP